MKEGHLGLREQIMGADDSGGLPWGNDIWGIIYRE